MYRVEPLSRGHSRSAFDCGISALNIFLQQQAQQQSAKNASRTFVLIEAAAPAAIKGYFSLVLSELDVTQLPPALAKKYAHPVGAVTLARLVVDKASQRQGIGGVLLVEAMRRTVLIAQHAGGMGMFTDAKDSAAASYYVRYGFAAFSQNPLRLFLPLATLQSLVSC